jgi:ApaG protein
MLKNPLNARIYSKGLNFAVMVKTTTHNIEVSVDVKYWDKQSIPKESHYFFVYFITIENKSDFSVQLTKRHWDIFDSIGERREVDGDGVVGETPVIEPGQKFQYNSGCNLTSEIGYMQGYYSLVKLIDNKEFRVEIPKFELVVPAKMN